MKLKTVFFDGAKHSDCLTAIAWRNSEEVFSCGDDHVLMQWNFLTNDAVKIATFPSDFYPTSLHWCPKQPSAGKKASSELLLAACANGKFYFISKTGRIERIVEAHQGAVLVSLWSYDAAGLLTAGEDGQVKIWSKSGMLRSTVIGGDVPVYTAAWGPDSNQVILALGRTLLLKPLAPNSKPNRWKAHDGVILCVAWNQSNNLIISGAEDCRYKVWDALGHSIYTSSPHEHPVTSLAWAPGGDLFAVGSFDTLRLCDRVGWSHSLDKASTGTIFDLAWSPDGTQLAGACGNGSLIFGHVIDRRLEWKNIEVILTVREVITVRNVLDETEEKLEFPDRVAKMALGYEHLVVTTPSQCHIFSSSNWNTPIIVQLKDGAASLILLSYKIFMLVERTSMNVYSYDGKLQCSPKVPGLQIDKLAQESLSLSPDMLALVDEADNRSLHLLDLSNRQSTALTPLQHSQGIIQVALSQNGSPNERLVAFLDSNRDAHVFTARAKENRRPMKLATMIQGLCWSTDCGLLAGVRDAVLHVWCVPQAVNIDKNLLRLTTITRDLSDIGKNLSLVSFIGNQINLRRLDGANVCHLVPSYVAILLNFVSTAKWEESLRLCRFINDGLLWACLACLACLDKNLDGAEEAFAAIGELDKISFIKHIKSLPMQPTRNAYLAVLAGNPIEAENILLHNGQIFRTILLLTETHNWTRALDLAIRHRTHVDTVLYKRKQYLEAFGKDETNDKILQYQKEVTVDEQTILEKIANELAKEKL